MYYELGQCYMTGNWWIWKVHEDGFREIVRTLSADLSIRDANYHMNAYIEEQNNG